VVQYIIIVIDTNYTLINDLMIHLINHQINTHKHTHRGRGGEEVLAR